LCAFLYSVELLDANPTPFIGSPKGFPRRVVHASRFCPRAVEITAL
jgi:hypothetical protein